MDMAIICKDAAREYIKFDKNFEIVATLVQNSDVFLMKNSNPLKIGITQKRNYQRNFIISAYPDSETVELLGTALPYALNRNLVDALVIDKVKAIGLEGVVKEPEVKADVDTYVLIVNKNFKNTQTYANFAVLYNKSVEALQDKDELVKTIEIYKKYNLSNKDMEMVNNWKLKLLPIK